MKPRVLVGMGRLITLLRTLPYIRDNRREERVKSLTFFSNQAGVPPITIDTEQYGGLMQVNFWPSGED
jgi:hypothetical protein